MSLSCSSSYHTDRFRKIRNFYLDVETCNDTDRCWCSTNLCMATPDGVLSAMPFCHLHSRVHDSMAQCKIVPSPFQPWPDFLVRWVVVKWRILPGDIHVIEWPPHPAQSAVPSSHLQFLWRFNGSGGVQTSHCLGCCSTIRSRTSGSLILSPVSTMSLDHQ